MRTELIRNEVTRLVRQVPFRPFLIFLENGTPIFIEHPENIAFEAGVPGVRPGSLDFYVLSGGSRVYGSFEAVATVIVADPSGLNGAHGQVEQSAPNE